MGVVESRRCNIASVGRGQKVLGSLELWWSWGNRGRGLESMGFIWRGVSRK